MRPVFQPLVFQHHHVHPHRYSSLSLPRDLERRTLAYNPEKYLEDSGNSLERLRADLRSTTNKWKLRDDSEHNDDA